MLTSGLIHRLENNTFAAMATQERNAGIMWASTGDERKGRERRGTRGRDCRAQRKTDPRFNPARVSHTQPPDTLALGIIPSRPCKVLCEIFDNRQQARKIFDRRLSKHFPVV